VQTESSVTPFSLAGGRRKTLRTLTLPLLVATVACASLTSCHSEAVWQKNALIKRIQPPQPVLAGTAAYGGDRLTAQCWLGPAVRLKKTIGNAEPGERPDPTGPLQPEPDSSGGNHRKQSDIPFEPGAADFTPHEIEEMYGRVDYDAVMSPRLALTFRFANSGVRPVTFTIADVNSSLGDFAPRPETLTVAPGGQGSINPMLSNFDMNLEELQVTLSIKIDGKTETRVLYLRRAQEPPAPARGD
jgi:hypothetical protein